MIRDIPCWFDEQGLHGNKRTKAKAYNRDKLIKRLGVGLFELLPLKGNSRTQTVFYNETIPLSSSCTCQNFKIKGECEK